MRGDVTNGYEAQLTVGMAVWYKVLPRLGDYRLKIKRKGGL
jgi:hypothetical protein